jgi:hypothetical protein
MANETTFDDLKSHTNSLKARYSERNELYDNIEKMVHFEWDNAPSSDHFEIVISPSAHDAFQGAVRLMTATAPKINVPFDKNNQKAREESEPVEKAANALWYVNGLVRQNPLEIDLTHSGLLFGEMCAGVIDTNDLVEQAKGGKPGAIKRAERVRSMTPYLFDVYDPRACYPEYDRLGLAGVYRESKVLAGEILDAWGSLAVQAAGLDPEKRFDDQTLCEYWDWVYHAVWVEGKGDPLYFEEHNLPTIPIVCQIVEGSMIHEKEVDRRHPLLYGAYKSGLWEEENLMMSIIFSNIRGIGGNTQFVFKTPNLDGKGPATDWDVLGGVTIIGPNEDYKPMERSVIDPSVQIGLQIAQSQNERSTMFNQTLGQPLGGQHSFSEIALLNQAGRLPLVSVQRRGGWHFGRLLQTAFDHWREVRKGGAKIRGAQGVMEELKANQIPESLIIEAVLDISMPQDERTNAMVAAQLTDPRRPLASLRWTRENVLGIDQSKEMEEEILEEQLLADKLQMERQLNMQKLQMQLQQQAMPQQQAPGMGAPQVPQMPEQMGGGVTEGFVQPNATAPGVPAVAPTEPMPGGM